jgi:hypothetical protein
LKAIEGEGFYLRYGFGALHAIAGGANGRFLAAQYFKEQFFTGMFISA